MNILALDTSGPVASCALVADGRVLHAITALHGRTHSESIMPMVDEALAQSGIAVSELDCVAAVAGPGSFTGVRIGVCAAKGLAHVNNIPCARIDALEAIAMNFFGFDGVVAPILDARRQQVYCAGFDMKNGLPIRLMEDAALPIEEFLAMLPMDKRVILAGDGLDAFRAVISQRIGDRACFAPANLRDIHPEAVAVLAEAHKDEWMSGALLTPIYLRAPQAERERKARLDREARA